MIQTLGDEDLPFNIRVLPYPTIKDLQSRIKRQAKKANLKTIDKEGLLGLELNLLSNKVIARNQAYNSLDNTIYMSSFFRDKEFMYLIIVSMFN